MRDGLPDAMSAAKDCITVTVELCGRLADAGDPFVSVAIPAAGCTAAELLACVAQDCPALKDDIDLGRVKVCITDAVVSAEARLLPHDRIALFPPVSGG